MYRKNFLFVASIVLLGLVTLFITSCSSNVSSSEQQQLVSEINNKYYTLGGKFSEITFRYKSSFYSDLLLNAPQDKVRFLKDLQFYAVINSNGNIRVKVEGISQNASKIEQEFINRVIATMKRQIEGVFFTTGRIWTEIIDTKHSIVKMQKEGNRLLVESRLKESNVLLKTFFNESYIIVDDKTYVNNKLVSKIKNLTEMKGNKILITGIESEQLLPNRMESKIEIEYKAFNNLDLPHTLRYQGMVKGGPISSLITLEPLDLKK